jgi:hypothetical protein
MPELARIKNGKELIVIHGGLHDIKGNASPYFSITADVYENNRLVSCGCQHDLILEHRPNLADLVALHLSDIDGQPLHALENGFYWLGGTHWQRPDYKVAAEHFRISESEARNLTELFGDHFSQTGGFLTQSMAAQAKARLAEWVKRQKPRWKAEADACIAEHGLTVYS